MPARFDRAIVHNKGVKGKSLDAGDAAVREHHYQSGAKSIVEVVGAFNLVDDDGNYYFRRVLNGSPTLTSEAAPTSTDPSADPRWWNMTMWNKASLALYFTGDAAATCTLTMYAINPDGRIVKSSNVTGVFHMADMMEDFIQKRWVMFVLTNFTGSATAVELVGGGI